MRVCRTIKQKAHLNEVGFLFETDGVADGARTHDNRNHNPGLYQLSYSHHWSCMPPWPKPKQSGIIQI